jgi:hypothetical protein
VQLTSSPLYTLKAPGCSWGNLNAIQAIYTAAVNFGSGFNVRDINKFPGPGCATHETHGDGADADITHSCATAVSGGFCPDEAIRLAQAFIDTGEVCRILFGTPGNAGATAAVRAAVNDYFNAQCSYAPSGGTFMIPYDGHDDHFHVDFKNPDGSC